MFVAYMTYCVEHCFSHVCWSVFSRIRRREHIGLLKFDKFLSDEVPLLVSYKQQLELFESQGKIYLLSNINNYLDTLSDDG